MSEFFKNPSLLTKDRLKTDLKANGIPLPKVDQKKDFYVQLYLEHLSPKKQNAHSKQHSGFSSDEDTPSPKSRRRSNFSPKKKSVLYTKEARELPFDVKALSDGDLVRQLKSFGETPGPITETTRQLYQKKLARLLTTETKPSSSQENDFEASNSADYSDSDVEPMEMDEPVEIDEPLEIDEPVEKSSEEELDDQVDALVYRKRSPKRAIETTTTIRTTRAATRRSLGRQKMQELEEKKQPPVIRKATEKSVSRKGFLVSHWKLLLFFLILLAALLVYFYMEKNPPKPRISTPMPTKQS